MKISLAWVKDYVVLKASADEIARRLTLAGLEAKTAKVEGEEAVMDVEITSNRPDWLSHIGVAREVAAVFDKKLVLPKPRTKRAVEKSSRVFRIAIENPKLCPYYSAVYLEGINNISTPEPMKRRLEAMGLRSIHFPVDVTNYVLFEMGQPLHAFDADRIQGDTIYVRPARKGEKLLAIDGRAYELISTDLVIADTSGPIALAGVMGGKSTEVDASTKNILLESAFFAPSVVRSTSRRLSLASDSSYRFERKVDPEGVNPGREQAVRRMLEHTQIGKISPVFTSGMLPASRAKISVRPEYFRKVLGISLSGAEISKILSRLGFGTKKTGPALSVSVPSFRPDVRLPVDLVEEVARIYGYDRLPETLPAQPALAEVENTLFGMLEETSRLLTGAGFDETIHFSLIHADHVTGAGWNTENLTRIINPQNKELTLMRPTLMMGLLETIQRNLNVGNFNLSLFEIGKTYGSESAGTLPDEIWHLGLAVTGKTHINWKDKGRPVTLYDLKGVIEMLGQELGISPIHFIESKSPFLSPEANLEIRVGLEPAGFLGELAGPVVQRCDIEGKVYLAELNLEIFFRHMHRKKEYVPVSKFPRVERDLALLVPKP
ncbi:MAG: phenylalanine--tRNA ligase subunit beta, partial [Candidatus Omnitrophica bacterium]|nr:phenylalanine--tRNA ligase subunit beta [Candidatus Omnitrophota bacterium]